MTGIRSATLDGKRLHDAFFGQLAQLGYDQAFAGIALPNEASAGLHESMGSQPRWPRPEGR